MTDLAPDDYIPSNRDRLRFFRRGFRSDPVPASTHSPLTASGLNVDFSNESIVQSILRNRQQWQTQVWDAYDAVGEVHNAVNSVADLMSRVRLFAAEESPEPDAQPVRSTDKLAVSTMERLGTTVEISRLLHDMTMQKLLPGELYLIGLQPAADRPNKSREEWLIVSIDELKAQGSDVELTHPTGVIIRLTAGSDTWIRIWTPHPRKRSLADSPLRPLLGSIDELVWWDAAAVAAAQSRAALAGFIGIPSNLETPPEASDPPGLTGNQRFVSKLFRNIIRAIKDPRSPSAAAPFIYTYPWNDSGKSGLDVTSLERPQDELLEKRTDRSLHRIAQGFPLPPEHFFGMGDVTFRNAGQIDKAKFTEIVEPFVVDLVGDLTMHWYRPILDKQKIDSSKFLIWYDASALVVPPRIEEQANHGVEYGAINLKAWRRVSNFSETDAPTDAEGKEQLDWIRALRGREGNPAVQNDTQSKVPGDTNRDFSEPNRDHPPRDRTGPRGKGQPAVAASIPVTPISINDLGHRLASIDSDLLSRLQVMASEQMRQALIKSGNFLRNRAKKNPTLRASIRNTPAEDVPITLGRDHANLLGTDGMLDDTFTDVPRLFSDWCDRAIGAAIEAAQLPASVVSSSTFQLSYSTADAATQLVRELKELAASLAFTRPDPDSLAPESDDLYVPVSVIRRALARVGNPSPNGHVNLLLATGRSFTSHLAEAGHFCTDHAWVYPSTPRTPYNAHRSLDGQRFRVDDSPNQPGSGEHCRCLGAPIFE